MAFGSGLGVKLSGPQGGARHGWFFGEDQARYLLAVEKNSVNPVVSTAKAKGIAAQVVGTVGGDRVQADGTFDVSLKDLRAANEAWLPNLMSGDS